MLVRPGLAVAAILTGLFACSSPEIKSKNAGGGGGGAGAGGGGGGAGAGGTQAPGRGPARLEVTPGNEVLLIDRGKTVTRPFVVTMVRADGSSADVTARAKLTSTNAAAGVLRGAVFESASMTMNQVGFTHVDAVYEEGGQT